MKWLLIDNFSQGSRKTMCKNVVKNTWISSTAVSVSDLDPPQPISRVRWCPPKGITFWRLYTLLFLHNIMMHLRKKYFSIFTLLSLNYILFQNLLEFEIYEIYLINNAITMVNYILIKNKYINSIWNTIKNTNKSCIIPCFVVYSRSFFDTIHDRTLD